MKEPMHHWQYGRLSGYHWCCIAWFYVRFYAWIKTGMYQLFKPRRYVRGAPQHVLCPVHQLMYKLGRFSPKYFRCEECGWLQLGAGPCAVEAGHEGWVRKRIEEYYSKEDAVFVTLPGKIAEKIRSERIEEL